jgi:subtilisin family serine protease
VEHVASLLRRPGLVLAVVVTLLAVPVTDALAASAPPSGLAAASPSTPAAVTPEVTSKAAKGEVPVIAVTRVPGEQVVGTIAAGLPPAAAQTATGGKARQVAVTVDAEGLRALAADPDVVQVVENKVNRITADPWTTAIGLPAAQAGGWNGDGRTVAVLDTGVQSDHPYLAGKVVAEACFSPASVAGQIQSLCPGQATEAHGAGAAAPCTGIAGCEHGTHVAGIAAGGPVATSPPHTGVATGASIIAVKVFTEGINSTICQGPQTCLLAYDSQIADAMAWLSSLRSGNDPLVVNLDAINLSLGAGSFVGTCDTNAPTILSQVTGLRSQGVATVVAAGNNGQNGFGGSPARMSSPACLTGVISVGATISGGASIASYSNLTSGTTVVAPGSSIVSSVPGSAYGTLSGTSMATPVVAGAIATLREQTPAISVTAMVTLLRTSASPMVTAVGPVPEVQLDSALLGVPSDVRQISAAPSNQSLAVSWSPPAFAGTSSIASYTVTASPGGSSCTTAGLSCTVSGLTNGSGYALTVVATNAAGSGSGTTATATPGTVPSGQGPPSVVAGDRQVSLSWAPPTDSGGLPITGYVARAVLGGQSCSVGASTLSCTVSGLTNGTGQTFTVAATNAAGDGVPSVPSAAAVPKVAGASPFGSFDFSGAGPGSVTVAGWAIDPDTAAPIAVHVYVDGAGTALTADASRVDVDAAFGYGANHGFAATVPAPGGVHTVCAYGINASGSGSNALLGCRVVSVASGSPFGSLDLVGTGLGSVSVAGWAIDPDTAGSIQVHVYVDGSGYALDARSSRPDVGAAYAGYGSAHGFGVTVPASGGSHTVCAYGINVGAGSNSVLGCRVVSVPGGSPFGSLDLARRNLDGTITVAGWAIDPDTAADIQVHVYFVGPTLGLMGIPLIANQTRADVGGAYPAYGSAHGYSMVSPALPSGVTLCAYGINVGSGGTSVIGCAFVP